jgi:hypothetical protein
MKNKRFVVLGLIIIFSGFVYDILFAGIPYQDPSPRMLASYNFHAQIASIIRWGGTAICIIAGVAMLIQWFKKRDHN